MTDELAQPDVEDSRWTIDEQRHVNGMDCTLDRNGGEVAGTIKAIWLFPGRARARRRRARGRRSVQHGERAGQLRPQRLTHAPPFKPRRTLVTQYQDRRTATRLSNRGGWTLFSKSVGTVKLSPISGSSAQFDSRRPLVGDRYCRVTTVDTTESRRRQPAAEPQRWGGQYV